MKLFSRKGLAAAATAVALSATALTAPAMAATDEEPTPSAATPFSTIEEDENDQLENDDTNEEDGGIVTVTEQPSGSSGSSEDVDPDDIKDWVGVFTAVLGGVSALFVFLDRYVFES